MKPVLTTAQRDALAKLLVAQRGAVADCMQASFDVAKATKAFEDAQRRSREADRAVEQFFEVRE